MSSIVFPLLLLSIFHIVFVLSKTINYNICKNNSGHKIYIEFEETGHLKAINLTNNLIDNNTISQECYLEIITCPSCIIHINFSFLNLSNQCNETENNEINCSCEFIQVFEQPYEDLSTKRFCGKESFIIKSLTRNLVIQLFYRHNKKLAFIAEYKSLRNRIYLTQNIKSRKQSTKNYLISPYFPSYYLNDLAAEYVVTCPESENENCSIQLIFTDFQLATKSIIEFFDWNGQMLDVVNGISFRPPILISSGSLLLIKFYANGGTSLGFKAEYSFIFDQNHNNITEYITDCGGSVENFGGAITMMNMVKNGIRNYFCFWIIKPPKTYLNYKTYLYLKIANFSNMKDQSEIILHKSTTSNGKILEVIKYPNSEFDPVNPREHVQSIESGFYVSLRSSFDFTSRLAIVYAAFNYKECFSEVDFLCKNHRCIPKQLACDGFDHCGDGSDETISCLQDINSEPKDYQWYSRTPNYFFPKIDTYTDLKTATLIFIMSSLGLITLISTLLILLYRMNNRTRHERELQNHLQIITDLIEEEILDNESLSDEPPVYEAPPDYDEVVKINYDSKTNELLKLKKSKCKKKRSKKSQTMKKNYAEFLTTVNNVNLDTHDNLRCKNSQLQRKLQEEKSKKHFRKNNPFFYFSDKAVSSNIKLIMKRKWHSQGELFTKYDNESINNKEECHIKVCSFSTTLIVNKLASREILSDSELLNINSYNSCTDETISQNNMSDHIKNIALCHCEGACGCATIQNISKRFNKKISRKKYTKFSTR